MMRVRSSLASRSTSVDVPANGRREVVEIERQQLGVGQAHHRGARRLRQRAAIDEIGIGEVRVPVEVVVNGMVDAARRSSPPKPKLSDAMPK